MDELFELIKALSPSEKRYFKRFAKQHSEDAKPKYILLFDAYDSLQGFDQGTLKSRISDDRILKYLNQEKKYLKDKLLDCLRVYRGPRTVNGKLFRLLEEREILNELGLYKQGRKKLETAKKIATQYDKFSILIQVLSLERKTILEKSLGDSKTIRAQKWKRIDEELSHAVKSQENLARYHKSYLAILGIYRKENHLKPGPNPDKEELQALRNSDLFQDQTLANSFYAQHLYYLAYSFLEQLNGRIKNASKIYEDLIHMWEERPDRIDRQQRQFMLVLSNYLNVQHKLGRYEKYEDILERIRSFSIDNYDDQAENFQNLAQLDLLFFMNHSIYSEDGQTDSRFEVMQNRIEVGLKTFKKKINAARLLVLYYNLMILNFLVGDIPKANQWLMKIDQSEYAKKVRREIFDCCKVIRLIFLYDLEEYGIIQSFYRNNKRYLEREDRPNDFYLICLNSIYKLSGTPGKDPLKKILTGMKERLLAEINQSAGQEILGNKEILLWIQHKLEGKPLISLARFANKNQAGNESPT